MTDEDVVLRPVTDDELPAFGRTIATAFNDDYQQQTVDQARLVFSLDRTLAAFGPGDGDPVATATTLTRDLAVPGAVVPAGHVTAVGVLPTHRRRGLLTRIMHRQLRDIRDAGEPLAVLWASEDVIYGRFGYGAAAWRVRFQCDVRQVRLTATPGDGTLRAVPLAEARGMLPEIFERAFAARPGMSSRPGRWWEYLLTDPESGRHGASALRCLVYEGRNGPGGYALWRVKRDWNDNGPHHEVILEELVATELPAYLALWQFLLRVDLARRLTYEMAAIDEPLLDLVDSPVELGAKLGGNLWVRLVDVPAALAARRYAAPVDVVFAVDDPMLPDNAGRWRLRGDTTGASCEPADTEPDLSLGVGELGAAYLGGSSLGQLGRAGRVREHTAGALTAASTAFGWHRAPLSIEVF